MHTFLPLAMSFEVGQVREWLQAGGYAVLFGLLFSCGLGVPIPEDLPLIAAGILIAKGKMCLALAAPIAWLGIVAGDCMLYSFGYRFGEKIVDIPWIGKHVTLSRLRRAEKLFLKYGIAIVFVGRMFMLIRGAMVVTAGTARFKFHKFIAADGLGAVLSGGMFMWLGYWGGKYGRDVAVAVTHFRHGMWITAGILAILLTIFFFWRDRRRSAKGDEPDGDLSRRAALGK